LLVMILRGVGTSLLHLMLLLVVHIVSLDWLVDRWTLAS